jgi:hypothetical protein
VKKNKKGDFMRARFVHIILFCISTSISFLNGEISFKIKKMTHCTEQEIDVLAQMRITYFREYPYLYEGTKEYEVHYLGEYQQKAIDAYLVQAFNGDDLVGILTGCAFISDIEIVRDGAGFFREKGLSAEQYYYIGEAIIIPEYRAEKILPRLLYTLGREVKKLNRYQSLCFLTVIRHEDDERKPHNYRSTDNLWEKLGCQRPGITASFEWPTIMHDNSVQNISNDVEFWMYTPGLVGYVQLGKFLVQQGFIASKNTVCDMITNCFLTGFRAWDSVADFIMDREPRHHNN